MRKQQLFFCLYVTTKQLICKYEHLWTKLLQPMVMLAPIMFKLNHEITKVESSFYILCKNNGSLATEKQVMMVKNFITRVFYTFMSESAHVNSNLPWLSE